MDNKEAQTLKGKKILVAVSGSIAAIKTPILVSNLVQAGAEVRCDGQGASRHVLWSDPRFRAHT